MGLPEEGPKTEGKNDCPGYSVDPPQIRRSYFIPQAVGEEAKDIPPERRTKKHPEYPDPGGCVMRLFPLHSEAGEDGGERQDGQRIGYGQEEGGEVVAQEGQGFRWRLLTGGRTKENFCAEIKKENSTRNPEPGLLLDESMGDKRQAQACQGSVKGISRSRPQPGNKTGRPASFEGAPNAEDADGTDRGCDGQSD